MIEAVRPGSLDLTDTPFDRRAYANRDTDQRIEDKGFSLQADWDVNDAVSLTSITPLRERMPSSVAGAALALGAGGGLGLWPAGTRGG